MRASAGLVAAAGVLLVACGQQAGGPSTRTPQAEAVAQPSPAAQTPPAQAPKQASVFDVLQSQRQTKLYYDDRSFPADVRGFISAADFSITDCAAYYAACSDEVVRFNLVLIVEHRLVEGHVIQQDVAATLTFLESALSKSEDPWIQTEAAFALGNVKDAHAVVALRDALDSKYPTVVLHADIALQFIIGAAPALNAQQQGLCAQANAAMGQQDEMAAINQLSDHELAQFMSEHTVL